MNPDTLIFHIAGAQCRLDIVLGSVVYIGSDVRADVCLQSPGIAPAHCAIEVLGDLQFRIATLDGAPTIKINDTVTADLTVRAPFSLVIDEQELDVRLESLEKKSAQGIAPISSMTSMPSSGSYSSADSSTSTLRQKTDDSWLSGFLQHVSLSRNTKIALAATLTIACFYVVDKMWPGNDDQVAEAKGSMPDLSDFLRKFTLGSFAFTVNSAQRVVLGEGDDFDRYFADTSGPWKAEAKLDPAGTSTYVIRLEVKNLDLEKRQPFLTEFALTNLNQLMLEPDPGATQTLTHQFEMEPMPSHVEPGATHECLIAFEVPNEFLLGMIILVATENRLMNKLETRIAINVQGMADKILKLAQLLNRLAEQKMVAMNEMSHTPLTTSNGLIIPLGTGSSMMFRYSEGGDFVMGSPTMEDGRHDSENLIPVSLRDGFWMGEMEVTQKQWSALMPENPSHFPDKERPVDSVTWEEANQYITKLNTLPHLTEQWRTTWRFALPTEAQWEQACRAGHPTSFNNGSFYSRRLRSASPAEGIAWFIDNAKSTTQVVGTKEPNPWGLFDMHGNVWEWCQDWYYPTLLGGIDPTGPQIGNERVLRGGGFSSPESELRAARRTRLDPSARYSSVGFRVAIVRQPTPHNPAETLAQTQNAAD
jgi:formylglycine-generating enzyme